MSNQLLKTDSQKLMNEDLERWRNESPAAGEVAKASRKAKLDTQRTVAAQKRAEQKVAESEAKDLTANRNSAQVSGPDVKAQGWSAEKLADESVYQDETVLKAQLKAGKKVQADQ